MDKPCHQVLLFSQIEWSWRLGGETSHPDKRKLWDMNTTKVFPKESGETNPSSRWHPEKRCQVHWHLPFQQQVAKEVVCWHLLSQMNSLFFLAREGTPKKVSWVKSPKIVHPPPTIHPRLFWTLPPRRKRETPKSGFRQKKLIFKTEFRNFFFGFFPQTNINKSWARVSMVQLN